MNQAGLAPRCSGGGAVGGRNNRDGSKFDSDFDLIDRLAGMARQDGNKARPGVRERGWLRLLVSTGLRAGAVGGMKVKIHKVNELQAVRSRWSLASVAATL